MSKEATLNAIKQYHIDNGYKFVVVESKSDRYVARSIHHDGGCQWRLRASFSKIQSQWEIKKIDVQHSCLSTNLSADHVNLDSTHIASMVLTSVKANPSVRIKSLIAEIKNLYGYTIIYRKGWLGKQKALALAFGNWEQSYNDLPRWLEAVKESNPGTIVQLLLLVWLMVFKTAYEMKQPIVQAKLSIMRSEFKQAFSWIDRIPLEKWTQAYDGGKRYGHMTTNLAKCINFVLKGARSLPISALVKATFEKKNMVS